MSAKREQYVSRNPAGSLRSSDLAGGTGDADRGCPRSVRQQATDDLSAARAASGMVRSSTRSGKPDLTATSGGAEGRIETCVSHTQYYTAVDTHDKMECRD